MTPLQVLFLVSCLAAVRGEIRNVMTNCAFSCSQVHDPVCATNCHGRETTFKNLCELDKYNCMYPCSPYLFHIAGECKESTPPEGVTCRSPFEKKPPNRETEPEKQSFPAMVRSFADRYKQIRNSYRRKQESSKRVQSESNTMQVAVADTRRTSKDKSNTMGSRKTQTGNLPDNHPPQIRQETNSNSRRVDQNTKQSNDVSLKAHGGLAYLPSSVDPHQGKRIIPSPIRKSVHVTFENEYPEDYQVDSSEEDGSIEKTHRNPFVPTEQFIINNFEPDTSIHLTEQFNPPAGVEVQMNFYDKSRNRFENERSEKSEIEHRPYNRASPQPLEKLVRELNTDGAYLLVPIAKDALSQFQRAPQTEPNGNRRNFDRIPERDYPNNEYKSMQYEQKMHNFRNEESENERFSKVTRERKYPRISETRY